MAKCKSPVSYKIQFSQLKKQEDIISMEEIVGGKVCAIVIFVGGHPVYHFPFIFRFSNSFIALIPYHVIYHIISMASRLKAFCLLYEMK